MCTTLQDSCKAGTFLWYALVALVVWSVLSLDKSWELRDRKKSQTLAVARLFYYFSPCWGLGTHYGVHGEVRGQPAEVVISFYHLKARNQTQVFRRGSRDLYLPSHLDIHFKALLLMYDLTSTLALCLCHQLEVTLTWEDLAPNLMLNFRYLEKHQVHSELLINIY